jgi:hypothetical protein
MAIPAIPAETLLVLATLTVRLELSPMVGQQKLSVAGDKVKCRGREPVPTRVMVCDAPRLPESSLRVTDPVAGPAAVGAKDTLTVQLAPATRLFGQSLVSANPALATVPEKFSVLPPKLVTVTGWGLLDVPTS